MKCSSSVASVQQAAAVDSGPTPPIILCGSYSADMLHHRVARLPTWSLNNVIIFVQSIDVITERTFILSKCMVLANIDK